MMAVIKKAAKVINFRLTKAARAHDKFTLPLAELCLFFSALCARLVFADDIYIYNDNSGVLAFTGEPTKGGYPRVIRSEDKPKASRRWQADPEVLSYDSSVSWTQMKLVIGMARSSFHFGLKDTQS